MLTVKPVVSQLHVKDNVTGKLGKPTVGGWFEEPNGSRFNRPSLEDRPAVSTGHAYTAYIIVQYLHLLTSKRHRDNLVFRVAIMGAAGSTGKAALRMLMHSWSEPNSVELVLVDVEKKEIQLQLLVNEARACGKFWSVSASVDPYSLRDCEYVVVVTSAAGLTILPEHLQSGTVALARFGSFV